MKCHQSGYDPNLAKLVVVPPSFTIAGHPRLLLLHTASDKSLGGLGTRPPSQIVQHNNIMESMDRCDTFIIHDYCLCQIVN